MNYRSDIDGLRAVAVGAVVLFHAFPEYVPGGFVGVDVFFVISGFLISGIIFADIERGSFTLAGFFARRARRLFPALCLVLLATLCAGWLVLLPQSLARLGSQTLASAAFVANIYFWLQSSYFSPDAHTFPLLHLWSLGVEEQFYLAWPLIILALRLPRRWGAAIATFGALSLFLSVGLAEHREFGFYSPLTRAWELMAGAALAWSARFKPLPALPSIAADLFTVAGLCLIVASCLLLSEASAYPSWRATVPVVAALMILTTGHKCRLSSPLLTNPFAVLTGLISYPLYLWHWPLLVLSASAKFMPLTLLERGLLVVVAYVLAWVTFKFVEQPFRRFRPSASLVPLCAIGAAAACSVAIVMGSGFASRFPPHLIEQTTGNRPQAWRVGRCLLDLSQHQQFTAECTESKRPLIAVWGDSTAGALMAGLRDLQAKQSFGIAQLTANSCGPMMRVGDGACIANNERVLSTVRQLRPNAVLLHAFGPLDETTMPGWRKTIAELRAASIRVVVVGPVPLWKRALPDQYLSYYITHRGMLPLRSARLVNNLWSDQDARLFFEREGAEYISAWGIFCDAIGCLTRLSENGPITAFDGVHLTDAGSIFLVRAIASSLLLGPDKVP